MDKGKKTFRILRGFLKMSVFRIALKNKSISRFVLLSKNVCLDFSKNANIHIGRRFSAEFGTAIAARENSELFIGESVYINRNCVIVAREKIVLEDGVTIGPNCCIYDHDHDMNSRGDFISKPIVVGKNSWIGAGCIIVKGVTIGQGCVIAAGTIVTKDVPDGTLIRHPIAYAQKFI